MARASKCFYDLIKHLIATGHLFFGQGLKVNNYWRKLASHSHFSSLAGTFDGRETKTHLGHS